MNSIKVVIEALITHHLFQNLMYLGHFDVQEWPYLEWGFVEAGEGPPRVRGLELGRGDRSRLSVGVDIGGLVEAEDAVCRQRT